MPRSRGEEVSVGEEGAEPENKNGRVLREFLESESMLAVNTIWRGGSGYTYGSSRTEGEVERRVFTRVDYVLIPTECLRDVLNCRVMYKEGILLQLSKGVRLNLIDHAPVRVVMKMWPVRAATAGAGARVGGLDRRGLANAANGTGRETGRREQMGLRVREEMQKQGIARMLARAAELGGQGGRGA